MKGGACLTRFGTSVTWVLVVSCLVCLVRSHEVESAGQHEAMLQDAHDDSIASLYHSHSERMGLASNPDQGQDTARTRVPIASILLYTTIMALASGLGAIPFFIFGQLKPYWAGIANAVAVGVMMAASFDLLHEGAPHSPALTILGLIVGALFIKCSQDYLSQFEDASFENLQGADARKAMLIITVMAAHAFGEGSGVGVSFSGQRGWAKGLLVTIAIALHNVPEGMAVAGVMMSKGSTPGKALYWTLISSFPQAIVSVPSYLFVETFSSLLPVALGFAAGCMLWIAFAELLPDALENADHGHVATSATFSAAWLQGLSMFIASLEQPSGSLASPIQADPGTLAWHLLGLLPCLLAPYAATLLALRLNNSLPELMGAAAGSLAWLGGGSLLYLALTGRASALATLASGAGGACIAAMLLMATKKSPEEGSSKEEQAHSDSGRRAHANGSQGTEGLALKHLHERNGELHSRPSRPESPTMAHANNNWSSTYDGFHYSKTASLMEDGQGQLPRLNSSGYHADGLPEYKGDKQHMQGALVRGGAGGGSAPFAACALLAQGVPLGLALARSVVANPDASVSHLLLPSVLSALPLGLACAGLGRVLSGAQTWKLPAALAAAVAGVAGTTAACFLVGLPLGKDNTSLSQQVLESESWVPLVEASVAGALLLAGIGHAWPLAASSRTRKAHLGLVVALCVGFGTSLCQLLLCASSPYCLR